MLEAAVWLLVFSPCIYQISIFYLAQQWPKKTPLIVEYNPDTLETFMSHYSSCCYYSQELNCDFYNWFASW